MARSQHLPQIRDRLLLSLLLLISSEAALAEERTAAGDPFAELRLASLPLPGSADEVAVHPGQALEVFLSPSDFPDALVRLTLTGERAIFAMNLDETDRRGEAIPRRVRWPRLGDRPLEVTAEAEALPLEPLAGQPRPDLEALTHPEAALEWYLQPLLGEDEGSLSARVQAVRLVSAEGRTLLAWSAPPPPPPCADRPRGEPRCQLPGISRAVSSLAVHPSGRWVAVAGGDLRPRIDLWRGARLELTRRLAFPPWSGPPIRVGYTPDGQLLLVADAEGIVHAFEAETGGGHRRVAERARSFVVLDAGRLIATSDVDGGLTLWRTEDGTISSRIEGQDRGPSPLLAASGDGLRVAAMSSDGEGATIVIWELESEQVVGRIIDAGLGIVDLALDGGGDDLLATHDQRGLLRFRVGGEAGLEPFGGEAGRRCRGRMSLSLDGSLLACLTDDPGVAVFQATDGRLLHTLTTGEQDEALSAVAFSPDGARLLATAGGTLLEWTLDRLEAR